MSQKQIKADFDWPAQVREIDTQDTHNDGQGNWDKSLFLGTVFSLLPSGRYMSGLQKGAKYWEDLEAVAKEYGMSVTSGEGDPCDIFLVKPGGA